MPKPKAPKKPKPKKPEPTPRKKRVTKAAVQAAQKAAGPPDIQHDASASSSRSLGGLISGAGGAGARLKAPKGLAGRRGKRRK